MQERHSEESRREEHEWKVREGEEMKYGEMVTHSSGSKALMYSVFSGSDAVGV